MSYPIDPTVVFIMVFMSLPFIGELPTFCFGLSLISAWQAFGAMRTICNGNESHVVTCMFLFWLAVCFAVLGDYFEMRKATKQQGG